MCVCVCYTSQHFAVHLACSLFVQAGQRADGQWQCLVGLALGIKIGFKRCGFAKWYIYILYIIFKK